LAISPFSETSMAPKIVKSTCWPRIIPNSAPNQKEAPGNVVMVCFPVDDIRIFISFKGRDPAKPRFHFEIQRQFRQGYNWLPMLEYRFLNSRNSGL
jgi:hypothetical protein